MLDCISVQNMRDSDAYTIANFVPGLELMHRAAMGVFLAHHWQGRTAILCGSGNNGGDGFALACILRERGFDSAVFTVSERLSADSAYYAEKARSLGIPIVPFQMGACGALTRWWTACLARALPGHCGRITALPSKPSMKAEPSSSAWTSTAA